MQTPLNEIISALKKLGVHGKVSIRYIASDRIMVQVDGVYFGIWDTDRKTFVD